jgi:hypothetical protein
MRPLTIASFNIQNMAYTGAQGVIRDVGRKA